MINSENGFTPKSVSWEVVRNIANELTNFNLPKDEDGELAHLSNFHQGPHRDYTLVTGHDAVWIEDRPDEEYNQDGWYGFHEEDVCMLYWESGGSEMKPGGSSLRAVKQDDGKWLLIFTPSPEDQQYRGFYYDLFSKPEQVKNKFLQERNRF